MQQVNYPLRQYQDARARYTKTAYLLEGQRV